jgi:eukaryotic-like serine/threonine-protein kinase
VAESQGKKVRIVGRYALYGSIAAGGMATVHFGRLLGTAGFSRTVAIKRLHAQFAADSDFVSMFLDEARLAARIRHPNVVQTVDVVATDGELFLVMEYVPGESLARMARLADTSGQRIPHRIISACLAGTLHGLHAAHEAKDERGRPLGIVHRDVSPQNVLVGTDGVPRLIDFGVAKAAGRMQSTREGQIKGKLAYMPPEQLKGGEVTRATDIYSAGVMLWELITGKRLFAGENEGVVVTKVLAGKVAPPSQMLGTHSSLTPQVRAALERLDTIVLTAVHGDPTKRFATAKAMAEAIEDAIQPATSSQIADWLERNADEQLSKRAAHVAEIESLSATPADLNFADLQNAMQQGSDANKASSPIASSPTGGESVQGLSTNNPGARNPMMSTLALPPSMSPPASPFGQPQNGAIGESGASLGLNTLSTSASYVGLQPETPAKNNTVLFAVLLGVAMLVLGVGAAAVWNMVSSRGPTIMATTSPSNSSAIGGTGIQLATATATTPTGSALSSGLGTSVESVAPTATATVAPTVLVTASQRPTSQKPWPPQAPQTKPSTNAAPAKNTCATDPYVMKDGIRTVRLECR